MFLWKYIDLDPALVEDIVTRYRSVLPDNTHFFQSVDLDIREFMGLRIQKPVLIQVEPNTKGRIHTDYRPLGGQLALNIPLENCELSTTAMWHSTFSPPVQYTHNGQPYNYFDPKTCSKIAIFNVNRPVLFRTDIPHSANNDSDKIRKSISIRFEKDPWHLVSVR